MSSEEKSVHAIHSAWDREVEGSRSFTSTNESDSKRSLEWN